MEGQAEGVMKKRRLDGVVHTSYLGNMLKFHLYSRSISCGTLYIYLQRNHNSSDLHGVMMYRACLYILFCLSLIVIDACRALCLSVFVHETIMKYTEGLCPFAPVHPPSAPYRTASHVHGLYFTSEIRQFC